eukprot:5573282-Pleurochrysis_carterae.AAC.6
MRRTPFLCECVCADLCVRCADLCVRAQGAQVDLERVALRRAPRRLRRRRGHLLLRLVLRHLLAQEARAHARVNPLPCAGTPVQPIDTLIDL